MKIHKSREKSFIILAPGANVTKPFFVRNLRIFVIDRAFGIDKAILA
jgi:hypothetical protein